MENQIGVELFSCDTNYKDVIYQQVRGAEQTGYDGAIMVCNLGDIVEKNSTWLKLLPRVKPYYAVKCNDDDIILRVLANLGASFDCASQNEIQKVLNLGVTPDRIIYANTVKQPSMLRFAKENSVHVLTFDSEAELNKIKSIHPKARLVLRFAPVGQYQSKMDLRKKFGCDPSQVRELLLLARQLDLDVVGTSFHVGSGCDDPQVYGSAIAQARQVFDTARELGLPMKLLDIGGGYPGNSGTQQIFEKIAEDINRSINEYFPSDVEIIAEPGTYMVDSSGVLLVKVCGKRTVSKDQTDAFLPFSGKSEGCNKAISTCNRCNSVEERHSSHCSLDSGEVVMYYVNNGVYGCFNSVLLENYYQRYIPQPFKDSTSEHLYDSIIWGPSCCASDCIKRSVRLPQLDVGDWIYFENMGAYTTVLVSTFNGIPKPDNIYVCQSDIWEQTLSKHGFKCRKQEITK